MFWIVIALLLGVAFGYNIRLRTLARTGRMVDNLLMPTLYMLLFALGLSLGARAELLDQFVGLGTQALFISLAGILGSVIVTFPLTRFTNFRAADSFSSVEVQNKSRGMMLRTLISSVAIVGVIVIGGFVGFFLNSWGFRNLGQWVAPALFAVMFVVGGHLGQNPALWRQIRAGGLGFLMVPILAILGTLFGTALAGVLLGGRSVQEAVAVGCGFGFYSMASVMLGKIAGVKMAALALLVNLLREVFTIVFAPLLRRFFGPLAPIASGGATTYDSTLPVILVCCGKEYSALAIVSGLAISFAVPGLISLVMSTAP